MVDFKLDDNGEIVAIINETAILINKVVQQVAIFKGEMPFNANLGIDMNFIAFNLMYLEAQVLETIRLYKPFFENITQEVTREDDYIFIKIYFTIESGKTILETVKRKI